ncbi:rod shape-determining protein [Streptomyces sp. CoT10]|uniref:rod shape-determining protein n=1 Tax=Streptomyces sp. CoT10 TaxID=2875762 RepID=UPI001CD6D9C7|nr:rod shape-determining protein [Streptomyces sp. CoT10]
MILGDSTAAAAPGGRRPTGPVRGRGPGIALDLGSARTRVWAEGLGGILDVPTVTHQGSAAARPVRRGTVVDPAAATRLVSRLLADRVPHDARPVVVLTTPALSGPRARATAVGVLQVLRPRTVLTIDSVRAAALGAGADLSGALLVIDVGAQLSEVALLIDGRVAAARRATVGTDDVRAATLAELVTAVTTLVTGLLRDDPRPALVDALDRGPLLAGGGALRPELAYRLSARLRSHVRAVPRPQTAAVRGAVEALHSVLRHPALSPPLPLPPL